MVLLLLLLLRCLCLLSFLYSPIPFPLFQEEEISQSVRAAHRRLALKLHPDKLKQMHKGAQKRTAEEEREDEKRFEDLQFAFGVLGEVGERENYTSASTHAMYLKERAGRADAMEKEERLEEEKQHALEATKREAQRRAAIDAHWEKEQDGAGGGTGGGTGGTKGGSKGKKSKTGGTMGGTVGGKTSELNLEERAIFEENSAAATSGVYTQQGQRGGSGSKSGAGAQAQRNHRRRGQHVVDYAKVAKMTPVERRLWELTMRDQREADDAAEKLKRLTCGEPNKCSVPRVVKELVSVRPSDGARVYQLRLQWRCKFGFNSGKPEHFELQMMMSALNGSFSVVYTGEDPQFETAALPDGDYTFQVHMVTGGMVVTGSHW